MSHSEILFTPINLGRINLANRVVMAPMTRSRAGIDDCVSQLHVDYYSQRASAGLVITEGTHPSVNGKGYCRTPGIYNQAQIEAWREVTDGVHGQGGKIVCQIMHCGRVGGVSNKAVGAETLAPSAIQCHEKIFTEEGMVDMPLARALSADEIPGIIEEHRQATQNAFDAGFDGVELHCTSGYLMAQFLSTGTNQREDEYGGSLDNRLRLVLEVLNAMASVDGADRVGMRICPGNPFNDLQDDNPVETFTALLTAVDPLNLAYLHVIRMASTGIDNIDLARTHFNGPIIVNDSYNLNEAQQVVANASAAAVSFGRWFVANPDLVERLKTGAELNRMDGRTLYSAGAKGYLDYPSLN